MENRFERLYGYVQRSLAKNIRSHLGDDDSLTIGILLFSSFSESFYYASTVKNTLLPPHEINKPLRQNIIWDFELIESLRIYFSRKKTKEYIFELLGDNNKLADLSASHFAITFEEYNLFKNEWADWFEKVVDEPCNEIANKEINSTKLFYFANYLLTIIRFPAYLNIIDSNSSYGNRIYRIVLNDIPQILFDDKNIDPKTAEFRPTELGNIWEINQSTQIRYSELALALEICFKHPFPAKEKIKILQHFINNSLENPRSKFRFSAMARPLQYNGEFQGIIFVTKDQANNFFKEDDFKTFTEIIYDLHIQSIIYSSKFDTAHFLLESFNQMDIDNPMLLRILNIQHLFSASPLGVIILPDSSCYIRYRKKSYMDTQKLDRRPQSIFNFLNEKLNLDQNYWKDENKNHQWFDIFKIYNKKEEENFNHDLNQLLKINQDLHVCSLTYMKFKDRGHDIFYFLFNSNHLLYSNPAKFNEINKQSFALRMHNDINKLIDTELTARKNFYLHNEDLRFLQLGVIHHAKNLDVIIKRDLEEAKKKSLKKDILNHIDNVIANMSENIKSHQYYTKVFLELNSLENSKVIDRQELAEIWKQLTNRIKNSKINFNSSITLNIKDRIEIYPTTIEQVFDLIVTNAIQQYNLPYSNSTHKEIELVIRKKGSKFFEFLIFNSGTQIPYSIIDIAGKEAITNGSNSKRIGIGLLLLKKLLERMNALEINNKEYFKITNVKLPKQGVIVSFCLPQKLMRHN